MKGWAIDAAILAASVAAFACLALFQIELPGLYYDEAVDAIPAMQLVLGQRVGPVRGAALWLGETALPLMAMDYVGAVNTYLVVPFFAAFGVSVISLRLAMVVVAAGAIVFSFLLTRELFGAAAARLATPLLAVHPSFVFFSRQGVYVTSVMALLLAAGLWCLVRWQRGHGDRYLYVGCWLFGIGVWAKVLFGWFAVAAAVVYVAMRVRRRPLPRLGLARATAAVAAFLVGTLPLVAYNVATAGTLSAVASNARVSQYGIDNLAFVANLGQRLANMRELLDGSFFWFLGGPFAVDFYPWVFVAVTGFGGVAALVALRSRTSTDEHVARGFLVLLAFVGLVVVQSCATLSGLWATHFYALLPLLMGLLGGGLALLTAPLVGRWAWLRAAALTVAAGGLALASITTDLRYHEALLGSRGLANHSDAIYALARYLDEPQVGDATPVALDWGIQASVQLLTQGRVVPAEAFGYSPQPDAAFADRLHSYLTQSADRLYLFHDYGLTVFDRREAFADAVRRLGREPRVEAVFGQADGRPVYVVESAHVPDETTAANGAEADGR